MFNLSLLENELDSKINYFAKEKYLLIIDMDTPNVVINYFFNEKIFNLFSKIYFNLIILPVFFKNDLNTDKYFKDLFSQSFIKDNKNIDIKSNLKFEKLTNQFLKDYSIFKKFFIKGIFIISDNKKYHTLFSKLSQLDLFSCQINYLDERFDILCNYKILLKIPLSNNITDISDEELKYYQQEFIKINSFIENKTQKILENKKQILSNLVENLPKLQNKIIEPIYFKQLLDNNLNYNNLIKLSAPEKTFIFYHLENQPSSLLYALPYLSKIILVSYYENSLNLMKRKNYVPIFNDKYYSIYQKLFNELDLNKYLRLLNKNFYFKNIYLTHLNKEYTTTPLCIFITDSDKTYSKQQIKYCYKNNSFVAILSLNKSISKDFQKYSHFNCQFSLYKNSFSQILQQILINYYLFLENFNKNKL